MRLKEYARRLRKDSTDAERLLWSRLRARQVDGVKFKRQVPLAGFIVDFVALDRKLVVEVDGGQHRAAVDSERTLVLEKSGYHVVRFWNNDVLCNLEGVLEAILQAILQELHLTR